MNNEARAESNSAVAAPLALPAAASLFSQALAFHRAGLLTEAERFYQQILQQQPAHFDSLHMLGVIAHQRGDHTAALRRIDHALTVDPSAASAYNNRGAVLGELKRFEDAVASYDKAIALAPGYVDALINRGNALKDLKRCEEALASYDRAINLKPDQAEVFAKRGIVLVELGRYPDALASFERAIALDPGSGEAFNNRGVALAKLQRLDEAVASYDRALALEPGDAEALNNRGQALIDLERFEEAVASFDRAIALDPDYAEAHGNRGNALNALNRFAEALAAYDRAMALKPDLQELRGNRLYVSLHLCDWTNFQKDCLTLNAAVVAGSRAASPFSLLATPASAALQLQCATRYCHDRHPSSPASLWRGERYLHDRIRIAYLSADLRDHATAYLMAGLFEQHDRSRFETIAISFGSSLAGDMQQRLTRSFDRFIDARRLSDQAVAECVRGLEVDIAVDLKGFTRGARTSIFARRPSPVQVSYLGYPGSMGASYIDYLIADRVVVPEHQHDMFSESVVYLPDSYQVNDASRVIAGTTPTRADLDLPKDGFVFCCFNNSYKITPDVFDVWMRLLREIEGSVLWLLEGNTSAPDNLRREAAQRGIGSERLIFAKRRRPEEHLARHRLADLFLDTYYCNAHTTASDALWAGLPVLTCSGATFASRVAASLLRAVGLPELITHSLDDYQALALKLARDPPLLTSIKRRLAGNRETHPLFNTTRFARHLEAAYITMWERARRGEPPQTFAVAPVDQAYASGSTTSHSMQGRS